MSSQPSTDHPTHLDPSELGTKEYWDAYYTNDLNFQTQSPDSDDETGKTKNHDHANPTSSLAGPPSPSTLLTWFSDVRAPQHTLHFLTSSTFPLSPLHPSHTLGPIPHLHSSVLDLGTGNGASLIQLRLHPTASYVGPMLGLDYSPQSVALARKTAAVYGPACADIRFDVHDLLSPDPPSTLPWWPTFACRGSQGGPDLNANPGFDLVLDKGTFDAISLSADTLPSTTTTTTTTTTSSSSSSSSSLTPNSPSANTSQSPVRACTLYPSRVLPFIKHGGFLLITSCNWTEAEVVEWFTRSMGVNEGQLEVWATVPFPKFRFGGQEGQGVASVCFRRMK